ncbi:hypothetical protein [Staphylococcus lutrae]|uniref:Uncharacterized protein n=1 Tax=Staphylococcus lutrae TaxID=155085 RepID=A0AAC9RNW7_9STAP|nr:hypothetical protein [Staphylococcus lutrae]ARJ51068.1 hypothetical protein B5P37_07015 [Staphylococcus lutrae]PNZ38306.1 hypothetical protein CD134_04780 [Staphylococcus lutrae]
MEKIVWELKSEGLHSIELNIENYTSIYNEFDTREEDILQTIYGYFQKRASNKAYVTIIDKADGEVIPSQRYQCWLVNHEFIEKEFELAQTSLLNKKIVRQLKENYEIESYLHTMNVLLEDLVQFVDHGLPIKPKPFDYKAFSKHLQFKFDDHVDYYRLINRLERMLPLIVEEMEQISNHRTLLIYTYPEANLSPKEQIQFRKCLESLNIPVITLTGSAHFLSRNLMGMNYIRRDRQLINMRWLNQLVWDAPMNYEMDEIMVSLKRFIHLYQDKLEMTPLISNHRLADIMLFDPIDIYVGFSFMRYAEQAFTTDMDWGVLPEPVSRYMQHLL